VNNDTRLKTPKIYSPQAVLRGDVDQRLLHERWRIVKGAVTITLAIATAIWSQANQRYILLWIAGYALWVAGAFFTRNGFLFDWRDRYETPGIVNFMNAGRGLWICTIAFVNWPAFAAGGEYFWIVLTLWSATLAGSMTYTTVGNDYFTRSIFIAGVFLTAAAQQWIVCFGIFMFLLMANQALDSARQTRISEVQSRAKLTYQARADDLTGLWNRFGLTEQLERLPTGSLAAMFVDLDRFKEVNDRFGHTAGDELLRQVAHRLGQVVCDRPSILARLGGDEFLLMIQDCPLSEVFAISDASMQTLEEPFTLAAGQVYISASIGTATSDGQIINLEQLIRDADEAMYRAKQAGRRRVIYYDETLQQDTQQRLGLESDLRKAVAERSILAWGQPIINHETSQIAKVELLARWQLDQTYISPNIFIGIATDIGLTSEIAEMMLNHAQDCLQQWAHLPHLKDTVVTVNIEAPDLVEGLIIDYLENLIFTKQIDPAKLVLEITERGLIEAEAKARFQIDRLHQLGIQVAIDDFGSGYSSLRSVFALPVDLLKFDRSLVSAATQDQRIQDVLKAMVEMANGFGLEVVGEGIETEDEVAVMKQLNIKLLQGYYYGRPMPLRSLLALTG
jgi:diguanylate cyclase (GGDEF)-like protein